LDQLLLWNKFRFHPFKGSKDTNRKPTKKENEAGLRYLEIILNEFRTINKIIAVGRAAEETILNSTMFQSYATEYVRHPANGGQQKFVEGIRQIINKNNIINE
jgi:methanogenic corrinoid protein MtbC1